MIHSQKAFGMGKHFRCRDKYGLDIESQPFVIMENPVMRKAVLKTVLSVRNLIITKIFLIRRVL